LRGNVQGFLEAASEQKWLEMHGLEHWTHFYTDYGVGLQKRFFSYFLKGEPNGWDAHPRVQLLVRHPGERYVVRYEHEWPLARTKWTKMYLAPGGAELRSESPASLEQAAFEAEGEGLTFKTSPMACEMEICGPAAAKLHVSSTTTDADLFVVIRLFDEMDREVHFMGAADPHTPIAQGWLRASHRKLDPVKSTPVRPFHTHDEVWPLTPGQTYELDIEIWTTNIVIPAGHRLGFSILGHDYEYGGPGIPMSNFKNKMKGCGPAIHTMDRQSDVYKGTTSIYSGPAQQSYILPPIVPTADASSSRRE
jgi:hypothetical protein